MFSLSRCTHQIKQFRKSLTAPRFIPTININIKRYFSTDPSKIKLEKSKLIEGKVVVLDSNNPKGGLLFSMALAMFGLVSVMFVLDTVFRKLIDSKKASLSELKNDIPEKIVVKNEISTDLDNTEMKQFITKLAEDEDKDSLLKLIGLFRKEGYFPNIEKDYLWEIEIRDALISKRKLPLIKELFPFFRAQTLSYIEVFYKPIEDGDKELVEALLEGGMNTFYKDRYYSMPDPFLYSVQLERYDIVKLFLKVPGRDINKPYPFPIHINNQYIDRNITANITAAFLAVHINNPALLGHLIDLGADCTAPNELKDRKSEFSNHPLSYSISKGYYTCFHVILKDKNININALCQNNKSPLIVAVMNEHERMARILISKGADVNIQDDSGNSALTWATTNSNTNTSFIIKELIEAGANPRLITKDKENLWHFAYHNSFSKDIYAILFECGIQDMIDHEDSSGRTATLKAIENGNVFAFTELLKYGANPHINLKNISEYSRSFKNLPLKGDITLKILLEARLNKLKKDLINYPKYAFETQKKIDELDLIAEILNDSPKPV
jgi:ankyrin repeat protein